MWNEAEGDRATANHTHLAETDMTLFLFLFPPPPTHLFSPSVLEYKKKYGEEHGSCQAGIAGFFTEVSDGGTLTKYSRLPVV